jgi:hypothetical protein
MKSIKEKHKLPLTFKYIEIFRGKNLGKLNSNTTYFLECEKYQTNFFVRLKPYKPLTKML